MTKKYRLTTTLNLLKQHRACPDSYRKLVKSLGAEWPPDKPINLLRVLKSNGVQDMCWCFRATIEDSTIPLVLCAADFAESVLKYFMASFPCNHRPAQAIATARNFILGKIVAAPAAAEAAAWAAAEAAARFPPRISSARVAAEAAARAAAWSASAAVDVAAGAAARVTASAVGCAARAAAGAAWAAAPAIAGAAGAAEAVEIKKQARIIRKWLH